MCGRGPTRLRRISTLALRYKTDPGIGPRLRHLRLQKGYTVETLAAAAGVNHVIAYGNTGMEFLFGGLVGLALGEWAEVNNRSIRLLWAGVLVIIAAANLVGLGMAS